MSTNASKGRKYDPNQKGRDRASRMKRRSGLAASAAEETGMEMGEVSEESLHMVVLGSYYPCSIH